MALDDIAALTFDVFGTVVDWRGSLIREAEALGRRKQVTADWGVFADSWRDQYQPAMEEVRSGRQPWTRLDDLHRVLLDRLLPEFGLEGLDEPERCPMVAAHYGDLLAAQSHGFRTCYVWRRAEFGTRPKNDLPAEHGLDLVVEDFNELADRLGCA